jgi:hypothetical protein
MIYDKDNPNYRGQRELPKELQLTWMVAGGWTVSAVQSSGSSTARKRY